MPHFSIIQEDIRENKESKSKNTSRETTSRKKKAEKLDFDVAHFKSIDFFSFLNSQATMKCNKNTKQSASLKKQHKNSKYAGIHLGEKEEKEFAEKAKLMYNEGQEQLKTSQHEKNLMKLIVSSGTGTRGLGNISLNQDTVKIELQGGKQRHNILQNVLKNSMGDNKALKKNFLGADVSFDRGITAMQHSVANRKDKSEMRGSVIDQLQLEIMNKKQKRETSMSKTLPLIMSKNKKLNSAYVREKRKLETEMMRMNEKLGTTAKILNLIRYDKSPTPIYKFKDFKEKLAKIRKYQEAKRSRIKGKGNKHLSNLINKSKKKHANSSNSSIITENLEPSESGSDF